MKRKEMEQILQTIMDLMDLLTPYVNEPERTRWSDMIQEVKAIVFATDEEA